MSEQHSQTYNHRQFLSFLTTRDQIMTIIDVLVVWYIVYKMFTFFKGTKAITLLKGVAVIAELRIASEIFGLQILSWLLNQLIVSGVIAAVIVFQPEIRRGLEIIGRHSPFLSSKAVAEDDKTIQAFDKAIQYMSERKIGALITVERKTGLDEYIETGIDLDADITGELLINIFVPNTPLHDGAVIVKQGKIAVACAYLPLSESNLIPKEYGTRHRAAVGISEVSDAVTIIVSEETGDVGITMHGELICGLSQEKYLRLLRAQLVPEKAKNMNFIKRSFGGFSRGYNSGSRFFSGLLALLSLEVL